MNISNKVIYTLIAVLVAVALVLGYMVMGGGDLLDKFSSQDNDQVQDQGEVIDQPSAESILNFPPPDASDADRQAHAELVFSAAEDTDVLDITACKADPIVTRIATGDSILVKNDDDGDHVIKFMNLEFRIEANSEKEITFDFDKGTGIYGFGCDSVPGGAGLFAVYR